MTLPNFAAAVEWLQEHADELEAAPLRMHDHAYDAGGTPRYSAAFWAVLTGSPFAAYDVTETRACLLGHGWGQPCTMCGGAMTYQVTRSVYRHPLAAALASLRKAPAHSPTWPRAYEMCILLMHAGYDIFEAAERVGHPIQSEDHRKTVEAAFTLAVRKLYGRWASGPLPRTPKWTELSSSQQNAEEAA